MPENADDLLEIEMDPAEIVRKHHGPKVFGLGASSIEAKIKKRELPAPIPLSASGRAQGWTGAMINEHRRKMATLRAERAAAASAEQIAAEKRKKPPVRRRSSEVA